jgi:hypothetical protein
VQSKASGGGEKGSVSTLESLSVYLTLDKARTLHGFRQEDFDLDDEQAFNIARMFSKCACPFFSSMCARAHCQRTVKTCMLGSCTWLWAHGLVWHAAHTCCCDVCQPRCRYDTNDDYRLDQTEFEKLCKDTGRELERPEARAVLKAIDADGSGCIDFTEFVRFWIKPDEAVEKVKREMSDSENEGDGQRGALQAAEKKA